jgi:hypothetical protein
MSDTPKTITISVDPASGAISASPFDGNLFDAGEGDTVAWECKQPFQLFFLELSGNGAMIRVEQAISAPFRAEGKLPKKGSFLKYFVKVGNQVLDPYIGVTH